MGTLLLGGIALGLLFLLGGSNDKGSTRKPSDRQPPKPPPKEPPKKQPPADIPVPNWSACLSGSTMPDDQKQAIIGIMAEAQGKTGLSNYDWWGQYSLALTAAQAIALANGDEAAANCLGSANGAVQAHLAKF